ncbi:ribosomal-protein-alanine N-acetyltransferase [Streptococcus minor]|uniref:[Ribosomal protein bS18]-alanine N-acetyltransferase n=1 Tax=Streptococcus minor TaxID=229549 RepID=A0A3P1VAH1_9STRE|nr:ribosomal protein S18-alanine N-acetyltransferase [Streptococcus minor]RRD31224.1 ribosomal-protein-alanine N-acetyltransferase [Streptococcus minor]
MERSQEIFTVLSDVYGVSPWSLEQIEADLNQANTEYFYLHDHQDLIGFLAIQNLVGELEITQIAIKKAYQGRGLGDQLMAQLSDRRESIFLEVRASNEAARALYAKYGFVQVGKRKNYYQNPAEDAILMVRKSALE